MDAFYASVELLRRPDLKGLPVAIGGRGDPNSRGVVTTATYAARAFGVRSGMPLKRARELCPQCFFLPVDFAQYRRYSRIFKAAIAKTTAAIEDRGIDEVYVDLSAVAGAGSAALLDAARTIKRDVLEATGGLTCSIGIAPNKLLAKLASEMDKPDGLTLLDEADLAAKIWPLPAARINGIGPKAAAKLADLGIQTIGELAAFEPHRLAAHFGRSYTLWLIDAAHGRDERPVRTVLDPKSCSRETTFDRDLHGRRDWHQLAEVLAGFCRHVALELQRTGWHGRTVGVKLRYDDFQIVTRDQSLSRPTNDALQIRRAAFASLTRVDLQRRIRLIGVRVSNLSRAGADAAAGAAQPVIRSLFDEPNC